MNMYSSYTRRWLYQLLQNRLSYKLNIAANVMLWSEVVALIV